jgi:hypothetical protein
VLLAAGFHLEATPGDAEAGRVVAIGADGRVRPASVIGGDADLECTFFRIEGAADDLPEPVALDGAMVDVGAEVVLLGRHGELMEYAPRRTIARVDAVVRRPHLLYAVDDSVARWIGSIAATPDGRFVGFLDSRATIRDGDGLMMGIGRDTLVLMPAHVYAEALRTLAAARAWIGINLAPFDADREAFFSVEGDWHGALVTAVTAGSPAADAGIELFDLVQSIGPLALRYERPVEWSALLRDVQRLPLGEPMPCKVVRFSRKEDGSYAFRRLELSLTLAERPIDFREAPESEVRSLGVKVKPLTQDWRVQAQVPDGVTGVVVTRTARAAPAEIGGLEPADIVLAIDGARVEDVASFVALCDAAVASGREKIVFFVRRGRQTLFLALPSKG